MPADGETVVGSDNSGLDPFGWYGVGCTLLLSRLLEEETFSDL